MSLEELQAQIDKLTKDLVLFKAHDHFFDGAPIYLKNLLGSVKDSDLSFTDITTGNVSSSKHGFVPKSPADATKFLNGAATPDYALIKDSDLSISDITTNNATNAKHGFLLKLIDDATKFLRSDGTWVAPSAGGLTLTKGTISNNTNVATSGGAGTNTDTIITHSLGKTPVKITISAAIKAKGQTNADGRGCAIAIYDSSSSDPISISGWYTSVDPNGTLNAGSFVTLSGTAVFSIIHGTGDGEVIKIQIVSIGATTFTFRINGVLAGTDAGASTVSDISWICEA